jgi:hypothetical protein
MVAVCNRTYVDAAATIEEQKQIPDYYRTALAVVSNALDGLQSERPVAIFCKTDECRKFFSGSTQRSWAGRGHRARGAAYSTGKHITIVIVRTDPPARGHLTHELVHVELAARLRSQHAGLPAWFHEGLAAHIANEPGNCQPGERGLLDLRKLDAERDWGDYTDIPAVTHATYCQARAEVSAWLARNGRDRFFGLVEYVRNGGKFYDAYGPMLTQ